MGINIFFTAFHQYTRFSLARRKLPATAIPPPPNQRRRRVLFSRFTAGTSTITLPRLPCNLVFPVIPPRALKPLRKKKQTAGKTSQSTCSRFFPFRFLNTGRHAPPLGFFRFACCSLPPPTGFTTPTLDPTIYNPVLPRPPSIRAGLGRPVIPTVTFTPQKKPIQLLRTPSSIPGRRLRYFPCPDPQKKRERQTVPGWFRIIPAYFLTDGAQTSSSVGRPEPKPGRSCSLLPHPVRSNDLAFSVLGTNP